MIEVHIGEAASYAAAGVEILVITPDPDPVKRVACTHGKEAKEIGVITDQSGIELKSKGVTNEGEWIRFITRAA